MATPAGRMVQDQNLNIHSAGHLAAMLDGPKTAKKGAFGGRKALNDISNSSKLSAASREQSSKKVVSKGKDFSAPVAALGIGDKVPNSTTAPVKGQSSGRKALGDLTNTNFVRSSVQNGLKKVQNRKLSGIIENTIPSAIKEEGFLHNHEECIKSQSKGMHFKYFLETVGLGSPVLASQPPNLRAESPVKSMKMKEIPEFSNEDRSWSVRSSPSCDSPKSMMATNENWKSADETFVEFKLIESPKLHNY